MPIKELNVMVTEDFIMILTDELMFPFSVTKLHYSRRKFFTAYMIYLWYLYCLHKIVLKLNLKSLLFFLLFNKPQIRSRPGRPVSNHRCTCRSACWWDCSSD